MQNAPVQNCFNDFPNDFMHGLLSAPCADETGMNA